MQNNTMRLVLSLVLIGLLLILLVATLCLFSEIPLNLRQRFFKLKKLVKNHRNITQQIEEEIRVHGLSSVDQWTKMRESEPDWGDLRTTSVLYFATELLFVCSITLVSLEIILLDANISYLSNCFLSACASAWLSLFVGSFLKQSLKPSVMISISLGLGLISTLFMLDYASTDTMAERK